MSEKSQYVWYNGEVLTVEEVRISPFDRGLLYGDGLFETIRADAGRIFFLKDHMKRMKDSAAALNISYPAKVDWQGNIENLLTKNQLNSSIAKVKIIITRGLAIGPGMPKEYKPTVLITAEKANPPSANEYQNGWSLHLFRSGISPDLAPHKTLNYLFFQRARQVALDEGEDESVIMDHNGLVTETASGSILMNSGDVWVIPKSFKKLPGITLKKVLNLLEAEGGVIEKRSIHYGALIKADDIWVMNSLIGIMPVANLEGHIMENSRSKLAHKLRKKLFR